MPKRIDKITGREVEISDEEFWESFANADPGSIRIVPVVRKANGEYEEDTFWSRMADDEDDEDDNDYYNSSYSSYTPSKINATDTELEKELKKYINKLGIKKVTVSQIKKHFSNYSYSCISKIPDILKKLVDKSEIKCGKTGRKIVYFAIDYEEIAENKYKELIEKQSRAKSVNTFKRLIKDFEALDGYRDSLERKIQCEKSYELLNKDEKDNYERYLLKYPLIKKEKEIISKYNTLKTQLDEKSQKISWENVMGLSFKLISIIILLCSLPISCMVSCNTDSFGLFLPLWAILSFVAIGVVYFIGLSKLRPQREEKVKLLKEFETIKADYDKLKIIPKYDKNIKY